MGTSVSPSLLMGAFRSRDDASRSILYCRNIAFTRSFTVNGLIKPPGPVWPRRMRVWVLNRLSTCGTGRGTVSYNVFKLGVPSIGKQLPWCVLDWPINLIFKQQCKSLCHLDVWGMLPLNQATVQAYNTKLRNDIGYLWKVGDNGALLCICRHCFGRLIPQRLRPKPTKNSINKSWSTYICSHLCLHTFSTKGCAK